MTEHILKAYEADINIRTEVKSKTAFAVHHGKWAHAYGYRFATPDRTIVISGDTSPDAAIVDNCHGCDVLIHEVYTQTSFEKVSSEWKEDRLAYHPSSKELAEIAGKAKPGLLILYHRANPGCDQARSDECRHSEKSNF